VLRQGAGMRPLAFVVMVVLALAGCSDPAATDATATPEATRLPTTTATAVRGATPAAPPAATASPTGRTALPTATHTATSTATATPSPTPTATSAPPTATPQATPQPTATDAPAPDTTRAPVIVIDPGHEQTSGGALGLEYLYTLQTALLTKAALEEAGYTVYLTREDNQTSLLHDPGLMPDNAATMDPGYSQGYAHTSRALQLEPDLYLSLHYNAAGSAAVAGLTVYYCAFGGEQNQRLAELVRDELVVALAEVGYTPPYAAAAEDGTIGKSYGHLATLGNVYSAPFAFEGNRLVGVPAVLTEPLFMTNPTELALVEDPRTHDAFARAYVRAIDAYFGR
jgi:N-acetylmuramoyl-L-alanine amidase